MKILIINWQDIKNPSGGGAEVHMHEIFRRIAANGHQVDLYACEFDGAPSEEVIDGINIYRKGSRSLFNYYVPIIYKNKFKARNYDIIIDDINKIPFYTPLFVKEPLLAISHHFFGTSIFRETNPAAGMYVYTSEYLVNLIYNKTPFAVVSESTKQEFISRGFNPDLFTIIPNAINPEQYPMKITEKNPDPTVLYFGRLKKYKSPDHLLRAFAIVKEKVPNAKLHIVGRGDFRDKMEQLAGELNIAADTTFFGFVSDELRAELLSKSFVAVNTSMKEGWGITNIEANACGTPVISANVPGLRDSVSVGESGLLYEYGNIAELAEQIYSVLTNQTLRTQLSEGAIRWAEKFTWDESARLMTAKCEEVIGEKG
jgi:glycosyltransferase involved in cell wall biosynthesis